MNTYLAILTVLSTLIAACLGVFTVTRNPRHPANLGFAAGMLALTLIGAGDTVVLLSRSGSTAAIGLRVSFIGQALLPPAFFLFAAVFARSGAREILRRQLPVLAALGIASLFFIIYSASPGVVSLAAKVGAAGVATSEDGTLYIVGAVGRYFYIYLILSMVLCMVHMENTLRSSSGSKRWQIKYIVFGAGGILAYFIYLSTQALLFSSLGPETIPLTSSVVIISTAILAVFIVRHRLMDVDIFISRYVIYNSLTVLVVGLYLIATGLAVEGIRYFDIPFNRFFSTIFIFVAILVLVITMFTNTLRRKAQLFINRHFYEHKYEFRDKWMETTNRISYRRSIGEIASILTALVSETMGAREIYAWIFDPVNRCYTSIDRGVSEDLRRISAADPAMDLIRSHGGPFLIDDEEDGPALDALRGLAGAAGAVLCAPLMAGHDAVGFILQGPDVSGEPYVEDDFELLRAMTTQAAVQIKNIKLSEDLLKVKELEAFGQMSSFIMHDLKNLTNSLSLVSHNAKFNMDNPEFQKDAIRTIDNTVERMRGLMDKLTNLPKEVELQKKSVGLKSLVGKAIHNLAAKEGKSISVVNEVDPHVSVSVDPEAMDMVILNIVTNAYDAINGDGSILASSAETGGWVELRVTDNGRGMTRKFMESSLFKPFITTKKRGFGVGLFQCRTLIEAHGGSIEVESTEGEGSTFKVRLPVDVKLRPGVTHDED